jgi:transcriptional antiterminator RfaH
MSGTELNGLTVDDRSPQHAAPAWFCLRTQPKHEHIAAANLRLLPQIEVFNPRIRYRRSTRRGPVWFTESLFPSYVFARFDWRQWLRQVHHAAGVATVVHFGSRWPTLSDHSIAELKAAVGDQELRLIQAEPEPGEEVQISGGAFHGLQGIVTRLVPARARVAVLLEFLGRQTTVEVPLDAVVRRPKHDEGFALQRPSRPRGVT